MKKFVIASILGLFVFFASPAASHAQVVVHKPNAPVTVVVKPDRPSQHHVWIDGHWRWDKRQGKYEWVPGHWAKPDKSGARWIPGHWKKVRGGWKWIPGHWAK